MDNWLSVTMDKAFGKTASSCLLDEITILVPHDPSCV